MADMVLDDVSIALVKAANLPISLAAIEEIIFEEDSSEWYYLKHYQHPEWPGGGSGITIADTRFTIRPTYDQTLLTQETSSALTNWDFGGMVGYEF